MSGDEARRWMVVAQSQQVMQQRVASPAGVYAVTRDRETDPNFAARSAVKVTAAGAEFEHWILVFCPALPKSEETCEKYMCTISAACASSANAFSSKKQVYGRLRDVTYYDTPA